MRWDQNQNKDTGCDSWQTTGQAETTLWARQGPCPPLDSQDVRVYYSTTNSIALAVLSIAVTTSKRAITGEEFNEEARTQKLGTGRLLIPKIMTFPQNISPAPASKQGGVTEQYQKNVAEKQGLAMKTRKVQHARKACKCLMCSFIGKGFRMQPRSCPDGASAAVNTTKNNN